MLGGGPDIPYLNNKTIKEKVPGQKWLACGIYGMDT